MKIRHLLMVAVAAATLLSFAAPAQAQRKVVWHGHPGWGWRAPGWGWRAYPGWGWRNRVVVGVYGYPYWYAPVAYAYPAPYPVAQEPVYQGRVTSQQPQQPRDAKDY